MMYAHTSAVIGSVIWIKSSKKICILGRGVLEGSVIIVRGQEALRLKFSPDLGCAALQSGTRLADSNQKAVSRSQKESEFRGSAQSADAA